MSAAELVATHQRDLNCLSDENRQTRKRALTKLGALPTAGHAPEILAEVWGNALQAPTLKLFADQVEKNRELAITLAADMLAVLPNEAVLAALPHVVPAVAARLQAVPTVAETAEEATVHREPEEVAAERRARQPEQHERRQRQRRRARAETRLGGGGGGGGGRRLGGRRAAAERRPEAEHD